MSMRRSGQSHAHASPAATSHTTGCCLTLLFRTRPTRGAAALKDDDEAGPTPGQGRERERETGSGQRDTGRTPPARPLPRRLCHPSPLQPTLRRRPPIADVIADAVAPSSTSSMPRPDLESDLARLCRIRVLHHHRHEAITINAAADHPSHASSSTPPAVQPRPLPSRRSPSPDLAV
uniref:Uncharacterized protein n=1 Tax=Oryza nivara TaxID=4536 RepID=A0A679BBT1_ORYNI|nr:hypothetical protein [Oryza sativa f. spontanea]